jgi:hypothetical protein
MSDREGRGVSGSGVPGDVGGAAGRVGGLTRRRLLGLGAAGLAAQWLALPARAATLAGLGVKADEAMSVGYLDGSERLEWLDFLPWQYDREDWRWQVVPAASLPSGDPFLAVSGVKITIHGLYPRVAADDAEALPDMAHLTVLYDPELPGDPPLVFHAWGLSRRHGLNVGQRVSFVAPVHREDGLSLAMEVQQSAVVDSVGGGGPRRRVAGNSLAGRRLLRSGSLTVGGEDLRPRLVRGIYFLGLGAGAFDRPVETPRPGAPVPRAMRSLVVSVEPWEPTADGADLNEAAW